MADPKTDFFDAPIFSTGDTLPADWVESVRELLDPLDRTQAEIDAGVTPSDTKYGPDTPWYDVRRTGAALDGVTNDRQALVDALAQVGSEGGVIFIPGPLNIGSSGVSVTTPGTRIVGLNTHIDSNDSEAGASKILYSGTGSAITWNTRDVCIEGLKIAQTGAVQGRGIELQGGAYFFDMARVYVEGFEYGLYGETTLYGTFYKCRFGNGTNGVYLTGDAGSWNSDWFNNQLVFINCQTNTCTNRGLYVKGMGIVLIAHDASECSDDIGTPTSGRGVYIEGDSTEKEAFGCTIINLYAEKTFIPITARYAFVTVMSGFAQGRSPATSGSAIIDADNGSIVDVIGELSTQDLFDDRFICKNSSLITIRRNPGGASTDDIDSTSYVEYGNTRADSLTMTAADGTNSDTGTVSWKKVGDLVHLSIVSNITFTSADANLTLSTLPAQIRPSGNRDCPARVIDNGTAIEGIARVAANGVITFGADYSGLNNFTASGTKGVGSFQITFML